VKTFLVPLSPKEEEDCLLRLKQGQREAWEELILRNMRLVAHVVKRYQGTEDDPEDLISIGTIGLIKAVDSFKADYGSRFSSYAIKCIDNEILMFFRSKRKRRGEVSLFEPIGTDKEGNRITLVDVLEYNDKNVAESIAVSEQIKMIRENMAEVLDKREYAIITGRYALFGGEELTQRELAKRLGISRSYVSRIEKRALYKLKNLLVKG
jgi:RNA polymerase sporulation-specific sigma factor